MHAAIPVKFPVVLVTCTAATMDQLIEKKILSENGGIGPLFLL